MTYRATAMDDNIWYANPYLLRVLLDEDIGELFWGELAAGGVEDGHEVVVEVVIAAHSNGEDAFANIICSRVFIT